MIFLLKQIISYKKVTNIKPIIKDGKFINLDVFFKADNSPKTYKITFRDSYLLLPSSLSKLAKAFDVIDSKGIFPYNFVNNFNISLNYIGKVPEYKYFKIQGISEEEYKEYSSKYLDNN